MDKRQLIATAARRSRLTRRQTAEALEAILDTIAGALSEGEPVVLKSFGRFSTWDRRQRVRGFDGRVHQVAERQVGFKTSAGLRRKLKERKE